MTLLDPAPAPSLAAPVARPLTGTIGAVVEGVDLRRPLDAATARWLRGAVLEHRVVFLRGQHLDDDSLRATASAFGPLGVSPLHRLLGTGRTTSTIRDDADHPPAGFDWHTDLSWDDVPPAFGFLSAEEIPPYGGDTLWADLVDAYESLPTARQQHCRTLLAEHVVDAALLASVERHHGAAVALELVHRHPPKVHPLVRVHPETGDRSLYLSPLYLRRIVGIDRYRGERLLEGLNRTIEDPNRQVRWRWRTGDVAIWDETTTCHRALVDHAPQARTMRRCVVEGTTV